MYGDDGHAEQVQQVAAAYEAGRLARLEGHSRGSNPWPKNTAGCWPEWDSGWEDADATVRTISAICNPTCVAHVPAPASATDIASPIDWYKEMLDNAGAAAELADRISCSDSAVGEALARLSLVVTHLLDENKSLRECVDAIDSRRAYEDAANLEASEYE